MEVQFIKDGVEGLLDGFSDARGEDLADKLWTRLFPDEYQAGLVDRKPGSGPHPRKSTIDELAERGVTQIKYRHGPDDYWRHIER